MGVKLPNLVNCSINYSLTCIKSSSPAHFPALTLLQLRSVASLFLAADNLGGKQYFPPKFNISRMIYKHAHKI